MILYRSTENMTSTILVLSYYSLCPREYETLVPTDIMTLSEPHYDEMQNTT
jgi:hypothetical protein